MRAFDFPPVLAESVIPVDTAPGDARHDALLTQPPAVDVVVVALVGAELSRFAAVRTAPRLHFRNRADHRLQQRAAVSVRSGNVDDQWDSVRIGQNMDLRSLLASERMGRKERQRVCVNILLRYPDTRCGRYILLCQI